MEIEMLRHQLAGLEKKGKDLAAKEKIFLRLSGLESEVAKTRIKIDENETKLIALKEEVSELHGEFKEIAAETCKNFTEKMDLILPEGKSKFEIADKKVIVGWTKDGKFRPYHGLSGGEKSVFTAALCYALGANVLFIEAGEMDSKRLQAEVEKLSGDGFYDDIQILINSWHIPESTPDGWKIELLS